MTSASLRPLTLHTLAMNIQLFKHLSAFLIELYALTFPIPFCSVTSDLYVGCPNCNATNPCVFERTVVILILFLHQYFNVFCEGYKCFSPSWKESEGVTLMFLTATPISWHIIRKVYLPNKCYDVLVWYCLLIWNV